MNHANLLPSRRIMARRLRLAIRRWIWIDSICAAVLVATGAALLITRSSPAAVASAAGSASMQAAANSLNRLTVQAALLKTQLQSVQELSSSPDWSLLLAAVSREMGDEVVFESMDCSIAPVSGAAALPMLPKSLQIKGLGRSQKAVSDFVLRLEAMHFFSEVSLGQTSPRPLAGGDGVGFQITCRLPDSSGGRR